MKRHSCRKWLGPTVLSTAALFTCHSSSTSAEETLPSPAARQPIDSSNLAMSIASLTNVHPDIKRHPRDSRSLATPELDQVLQLAHRGLQRLDNVHDYTCTLVRRERVNGRLMPEQTIFAKVRHEDGKTPNGHGCFSLYLRFDAPESVQGREILFCNRGHDGDDDLKLLVRNGGKRFAFLTAELVPTSTMAMRGNRYPITEFGLRRLIERMLAFGEKEKTLTGGKLQVHTNVPIEGRSCTLIEVVHESPNDGSDYHVARVLMDEEHQLPIHFSSFTWPEEVKQGMDHTEHPEPVLVESYTYRDLKLNVDLCDQDFDRNNSQYKFSKR